MSDFGTPAINPAALPASIRNGSADRRQAYESAMQFEQVLVQQLTKQLTDTTATDSDSSDGSSSGDTSGLNGPYGQMLPGAFADGIENGGGLGLAMSLTNAMDPITTANSTAGTTQNTSSEEQTSAATPTQGAST